MKAIDKIKLLERLGVELQSQMTFDEIDIYFKAHGIDLKNIEANTNSKRYMHEMCSQGRMTTWC